MVASSPARASADKALPTLVGELWDLVVAYVRQETVVPVKGLGRFVALGMAGSAALGIGLLLLALALLRALQTETGTTFDGSLSWAPYAITLLACAAIAALAARAVGSHRRRAGPKGTTS